MNSLSFQMEGYYRALMQYQLLKAQQTKEQQLPKSTKSKNAETTI